MQRVAETYRKIRNTFRYMLQKSVRLRPAAGRSAVRRDGATRPLHAAAHRRSLAKQVQQWYDEFQFHRVYQRVNQFCVVDLSALYFDVLKDRLYTLAAHSRGRRRSAQTALWRIGEALVRLLAPVMSFTADEVWQYLPSLAGRPESVHLALFPARQRPVWVHASARKTTLLRQEWQYLMAVRDEVLKAMETRANSRR